MDPPFPQQTTAIAATSAGSNVGGPKDPTNIVKDSDGGSKGPTNITKDSVGGILVDGPKDPTNIVKGSVGGSKYPTNIVKGFVGGPKGPTSIVKDSVGGPKDPTSVVKGKRTKRQRPSIVSQSSTSYNTLTSSPASYSDSPADTTTAEDEDTANCLILLSKGHNINMEELSGYKFNSKRYIQTPTDATNGLTGTYVYECKTCSRTFPSFQALGGHRARHKKPKVNEFDKPKSPQAFCDEDESHHRISSQANKKIHYSFSKLHECSICGAEFNSGQALGGHMRRHRAASGSKATITAAGAATDTALSLIPYGRVTSVLTDDHDDQKSRGDDYCLSLDLNLPAPPETTVTVFNEDQHRETSFKLTADRKKQQPPFVCLSAAPTLVDCYY